MGFLKCPRSSWASKLDAHPLVFFVEISYIYSSSASVVWQSLLLMLTSIDGHSHSPLIILVNVRLSPFLSSPHNPQSIFYSTHSAISMAHAHVLRESWKSLRLFKYETIAWLVIGGIDAGNIFVWRRWSMAKLYDFVGMNFHLPCYFEKTWLLWLVCLKYYYFLCQYELLFCIHLDLNIHATIKKITLWIMLGSIPHQKISFYHLPTRGWAGIKLGDAWYVSNVSIIFYCSMLLYYLFWVFSVL